jgi:prevent-host-death family protein
VQLLAIARARLRWKRGTCAKLVSVTRTAKSATRKRQISRKKPKRAGIGTWIFQDAKARLSEVVRRARSEGPQHVTVHGRAGVVILAEEEFQRLKGNVTGAALVDAMQASPFRETEVEPRRERMPVRDVRFP